jgi:hypothetical protein
MRRQFGADVRQGAAADHGANASWSRFQPEWTGVPLSVLLDEAGVDPAAKWLIAEGADAQFLDRSVPVKKAYDDALIAIYQNGEHLMPGNGYPMRLLLPGYQGNMNVKYLRRIKVINQPAYSYFETKNYSQILPGGKTWRFHFLMEVKSFITHPSFGQSIKRPGLYAISGLAYSGTGRISKVIVSADGGKLGRSGPARTDSRQGVHAVCQDSISAHAREILLQRRGVAVPMFPGSESREAPGKQFSGVVRAWNFRARNVCASRVAAISAFPAALSDRAF